MNEFFSSGILVWQSVSGFFFFFGFIDSSVIIHLVYQRECCVDKKRNWVYDWVEREGEEAALPITSCLSCQKRTYERKRGPAREEEK